MHQTPQQNIFQKRNTFCDIQHFREKWESFFSIISKLCFCTWPVLACADSYVVIWPIYGQIARICGHKTHKCGHMTRVCGHMIHLCGHMTHICGHMTHIICGHMTHIVCGHMTHIWSNYLYMWPYDPYMVTLPVYVAIWPIYVVTWPIYVVIWPIYVVIWPIYVVIWPINVVIWLISSLTHKRGYTKDKPFLFVSHFSNQGTTHHHIPKYLRNWSTFWSGYETCPDLWGLAFF